MKLSKKDKIRLQALINSVIVGAQMEGRADAKGNDEDANLWAEHRLDALQAIYEEFGIDHAGRK